jgi:hypothetical protein
VPRIKGRGNLIFHTGILFMLMASKYCLLLITFVSIITQAPKAFCTNIDNNQNNCSSCCSNDPTEICKDLFIDLAQIEILNIIVFSLGTIFHELGHATATKYLFDVRTVEVHIGTRTPDPKNRLFSLGNMHFYKTIPPWTRGLTTFGEINPKQGRKGCKDTDLAIRKAAGGLLSTPALYSLIVGITAFCTDRNNKGLPAIILKSFIDSVSPFSLILNSKSLSHKKKRFVLNLVFVICLCLIFHIFYAFTPYCDGYFLYDYEHTLHRIYSDGTSLWKNYFGVDGTHLKIAHYVSVAGVWACWLLIIKKYCEARKKLSPQLSQTRGLAALIALVLMYFQLVPKEQSDLKE